jgi:HEAT repeat protein
MRLSFKIIMFVSIVLSGTAHFAATSPTDATRSNNDYVSRLGMELKVSDPKTRLAIISRLGATRNPRAIDPLLKALKEHRDDSQLRQAVITSLGAIRDSRAVDTAIEALRDYVSHVRQAAAEALGKLGDKKAIVPLLISFDDKEAMVREAAVDSLAQLGEPSARIFYESMYQSINATERLSAEDNERLYDFIMEAFQHWKSATRENAIWVLGRIKHDKITDFLIRCLGDNSSYVSAAAVWSLKESLNASAMNARTTVQLISVLKHPSPIVREAAAFTLGVARSPDPVPPLIEALRDDKSAVREAAAWSLSKIKDQHAIGPLCAAMADPDHRVRIAAAYGLGELKTSTISFDVLVGALRDKNEDVRETAAFSLAKLDQHGASSELLKALEDPSDKVRKAAAYALGKIGDRTVADQLLSSMSDRNPAVREALAEALDKLDPPLGQLINKSLKGDSEAWALLADRRDPRVVQLFLDELDVPASALRPSAIGFLAETGEAKAQEHFVRMARGWNIGERFTGGMALSKLKLSPIYKNLFISLDILTSLPSITYFLLIVFLSGILFYAACPYDHIKRPLYAITFGSMIAGGVFPLPIFSFSLLFFAFLSASIFPFIALVSLSALASFLPAFRFLLKSDVDFIDPLFSFIGPGKTYKNLPAEPAEEAIRRPKGASDMGDIRQDRTSIMTMLRPFGKADWLATPEPVHKYVELLEQRVLQLEDTVAQMNRPIDQLESQQKRSSTNLSKSPLSDQRPKQISKRKRKGRKKR